MVIVWIGKTVGIEFHDWGKSAHKRDSSIVEHVPSLSLFTNHCEYLRRLLLSMASRKLLMHLKVPLPTKEYLPEGGCVVLWYQLGNRVHNLLISEGRSCWLSVGKCGGKEAWENKQGNEEQWERPDRYFVWIFIFYFFYHGDVCQLCAFVLPLLLPLVYVFIP